MAVDCLATMERKLNQSMTNINISLPESMQVFVEEQVAKGGYSSASEYVQQLIHKDQKRLAQDRLEELIIEGIESGVIVCM